MILPDSIAEHGIFLKDQLFDLRGLAAYSSLSVSSLRSHIKCDGLRAYQVHGKMLIRKSEFDTWLARFRVNRSQDLDEIADEVLSEIGFSSRRSPNASGCND